MSKKLSKKVFKNYLSQKNRITGWRNTDAQG